MDVDWNSRGMCMWKEEAIKEQQGYFDLHGRELWREFNPSQYNELKRNIGFALFGPPEKVPDENSTDGTGYTDKELEHINTIFGIIRKDKYHIRVSFLLVSGKAGDAFFTITVIQIPVFDKISQQNIINVVDSFGRVYEDWQDFLKNNMLPECVLCYPKNGMYLAVNGNVEVEFGISPAAKTGRKVLEGFDIGGTVLGVGASGLLTAAMFVPVAGPVIAGALGASLLTGGYAAGRSIQTLVDRGQHQQSISLADAESRNCWLGIGGCVMSLAAGGTMAAVAKTTKAGSAMAKAGQVAAKSVAVGSCVVNALGVTNGLVNIIVKAVNKEEITALDIFQFISTVLYFSNSVISARQAMSLINRIGENGPGGFRGNSRDVMNQIFEFVTQNNACNSMPLIIGGCSPLMSTSAKWTALFCVYKWVSTKLIEITKNVLKGVITICNYVLKVGEILHTFWETLNKEIIEVVDKICEAFGVKHWSKIEIGGCRLLAGTEPSYIREVAEALIAEKRSLVKCGTTVMASQQSQVISDHDAVGGTVSHINNEPNSLVDEETETSVSYDDEVINILATFGGIQGCRNSKEFAKCMTFICKFVKSQFQEKKSHYEKAWKVVKHFNPDANVDDFVKQYGISGNPNNHFIQEVFKKFRNEDKGEFTLLKLAYDSQNASTSAQKEDGQSSSEGDRVNLHQFYDRAGLGSKGMLSKEQYCELAKELTGECADKDSIYMSEGGNTAVMLVNGCADVITVHCLLEDGKVSGIAALLRNPLE